MLWLPSGLLDRAALDSPADGDAQAQMWADLRSPENVVDEHAQREGRALLTASLLFQSLWWGFWGPRKYSRRGGRRAIDKKIELLDPLGGDI